MQSDSRFRRDSDQNEPNQYGEPKYTYDLESRINAQVIPDLVIAFAFSVTPKLEPHS